MRVAHAQIRAQSLAQFLRYYVAREQFPALWMPPTDLAYLVATYGSEGPREAAAPTAGQAEWGMVCLQESRKNLVIRAKILARIRPG